MPGAQGRIWSHKADTFMRDSPNHIASAMLQLDNATCALRIMRRVAQRVPVAQSSSKAQELRPSPPSPACRKQEGRHGKQAWSASWCSYLMAVYHGQKIRLAYPSALLSCCSPQDGLKQASRPADRARPFPDKASSEPGSHAVQLIVFSSNKFRAVIYVVALSFLQITTRVICRVSPPSWHPSGAWAPRTRPTTCLDRSIPTLSVSCRKLSRSVVIAPAARLDGLALKIPGTAAIGTTRPFNFSGLGQTCRTSGVWQLPRSVRFVCLVKVVQEDPSVMHRAATSLQSRARRQPPT